MYIRASLFPSLLIFLPFKSKFNQALLWLSLSLDCLNEISLHTHIFRILQFTFNNYSFKVTEFRKRVVKEEEVSIEAPKREPQPTKGILNFD